MKTRPLILLATSLILLSPASCKKNNATKLNLDFEQVDSKSNSPKNWYFGNDPYYKISLDSNLVHKGKYSLKIENTDINSLPSNNIIGYTIIDNPQKNDRIKLTGFIKTENTDKDTIGLHIGYISFSRDSLKLLKDSNLIGTNDWKEYSVELTIDRDLDHCYVGVCFSGKGRIWIDDLRLYIDEKPIYETQPPLNFKADKNELKWIRNHCIPLKTIQPGIGFDDLEPLKQTIGNARIVGLGENTHGTSEVFKMKHRIVEFLATKMGFSIFSIEANMPEAYKLNDYVLYGKGDPKALLRGMYFWTWNTQEVLDLIEWMRKFNSDGKGKIQFTGFDMQYIAGALENISTFAEKHDRILKSRVDSLSTLLIKLKSLGSKIIESKNEITIIKHKCEDILNYLTENKKSALRVVNESEYKWLVQNANIMIQSSDIKNLIGSRFRDECMAKNIDWILNNNTNAKIVLWAHNFHVSKQSGSMGHFLSEKYGNNYFNIGFLSNSGTYTAANSGGLSSMNVLEVGKPGSFEYSFHKTAIPYFIFDFGQVNEKEPEGNWLTFRLNYRDIGAVAKENQFSPARISNMFNSIIYIDSTNASDCFNVSTRHPDPPAGGTPTH